MTETAKGRRIKELQDSLKTLAIMMSHCYSDDAYRALDKNYRERAMELVVLEKQEATR